MWLVCSTREGELLLTTREQREMLLKIFSVVGFKVSTHVVKVFEKRKDAEKYIADINEADKLIKNL